MRPVPRQVLSPALAAACLVLAGALAAPPAAEPATAGRDAAGMNLS